MEQTKAEVRARALALRSGLSAAERIHYSKKIIKNLTDHVCYREAQALLTYVSFRSEVDTIPLIEQAFADGKAVYVPKVAGREMDFFRITAFSDLEEGYHGIMEPKNTAAGVYTVSCAEKTLLCMPGAAFDCAHHRIGYGGGYYDRYLSGQCDSVKKQIFTAALAYDCQILQNVPWEEHDVCPALIVTETEIF